MIELIEAPSGKDLDVSDKIHFTTTIGIRVGDWAWSLCGLRKQLTRIRLGTEGVTCPECLARAGSYGY